MAQRRMTGALCFALMGLIALLAEAPRLVRAQQLPNEKVQRAAPLAGTKWMLAESAGQRIAQDGRQPYFELKEVERLQNGSAGQVDDATDACGNHLKGVYSAAGDWLRVRILSSTLLACKVTDRMPRGLVSTLMGDQQFRIHGDELDLLDNSGAVRARFGAARGE